MVKSTDYIIIGAGPAGVCAANILSKSGKKIVIVGKILGGSYCSTNSIVSESLVGLSKMFEKFRIIKDSFIEDDVDNVALDFKRVKKIVDSNLNKAKKQFLEIIEDAQAEYIEGTAVFTDSNMLDITLPDNSVVSYKFKKCLIATGAAVPKSNLYPSRKNLDISTFINMESIPDSVAIIGGGALGVEVASFFSRFGSKVTLVEKSDRLLPIVDAQISKKLEDTLKKRGINLVTSHNITKIERVGQKYIALSEAGPVESEEVFICTGRVPAIQELKLENAGVNIDENGFMIYSNNLQTCNKNIYIAGDVSHIMMNLSWAYYSATVAARNMLGENIEYTPEILPVYIDTDPEIALIGLSEEAAKARGLDYGVFKYVFGDIYCIYNNAGGQQTVIKTIYDKSSKTFLGIQAMGREVNGLIATFAIIMKLKITIEQIPDFVYINPVFNEFFKEVSEKLL